MAVPDSGAILERRNTFQCGLADKRALTRTACFLTYMHQFPADESCGVSPQKLAAPGLAVAHDALLGTLDYGSERVATATMGYKHIPIADEVAMEMLREPGFLLKIIPHVDGTPRVCELVRYVRDDIVLKGAWTGPAALELHPHALAPLSALPVLEVISGVHIIADFTLALGEVVHDYLA